VEKIRCPTFFVPQISQNLNLFYFCAGEEKPRANLQRIVIKLSKIWVWDPGSGIQDPEKPYSGSRVKKAPDPGSATLLFIINATTKTLMKNNFRFPCRLIGFYLSDRVSDM
jgi:hypothetical protein